MAGAGSPRTTRVTTGPSAAASGRSGRTQEPRPRGSLAALTAVVRRRCPGSTTTGALVLFLDPFVMPSKALRRARRWPPARSAWPTTTRPSRSPSTARPPRSTSSARPSATCSTSRTSRSARTTSSSPPSAPRSSDGDHISVRYGRKLTVTVDGVTKEYWTTATTVDAALQRPRHPRRRRRALRRRARSRSAAAASRSRVTTPKKVTVTVDGKTRTVTSTSRHGLGRAAPSSASAEKPTTACPPADADRRSTSGMKVVRPARRPSRR